MAFGANVTDLGFSKPPKKPTKPKDPPKPALPGASPAERARIENARPAAPPPVVVDRHTRMPDPEPVRPPNPKPPEGHISGKDAPSPTVPKPLPPKDPGPIVDPKPAPKPTPAPKPAPKPKRPREGDDAFDPKDANTGKRKVKFAAKRANSLKLKPALGRGRIGGKQAKVKKVSAPAKRVSRAKRQRRR